MALIKAGSIHYSSFVREIEMIKFQGETAIVMGKETVKPDGNAPGAGQTILRRYTNVWMRSNGKWQLIARQQILSAPRDSPDSCVTSVVSEPR